MVGDRASEACCETPSLDFYFILFSRYDNELIFFSNLMPELIRTIDLRSEVISRVLPKQTLQYPKFHLVPHQQATQALIPFHSSLPHNHSWCWAIYQRPSHWQSCLNLANWPGSHFRLAINPRLLLIPPVSPWPKNVWRH